MLYSIKNKIDYFINDIFSFSKNLSTAELDSNAEKVRYILQNSINTKKDSLSSIFFIRKDGLHIIVKNNKKAFSIYYPRSLKEDFRKKDIYNRALNSNKIKLLATSELINSFHIYTVITSVKNDAGASIGVLLIKFKIKALLLPIPHGKRKLYANIVSTSKGTNLIYCFYHNHIHNATNLEVKSRGVSVVSQLDHKRFLVSALRHKATGWRLFIIIPYSHIMRFWGETGGIIILLYVIYLAASLIITSLKLDRVTKPIKILIEGINKIQNRELNHKILIDENNEMKILAEAFNSMTTRLKNFIDQTEGEKHLLDDMVKERTDELRALNKDLHEKEIILREDLEIAKHIQRSVIHLDLDAANLFDFGIIFEPMIEVGGDIYDIICLDKHTVRIFVADASGHGVQGALSTMLIKSVYEQFKQKYDTPDKIINEMNKTFLTSFYNFNTFFSCAVYDINSKKSKITFASAGHPPHYIIDKDNNVSVIDGGGIVIGVMNNYKSKAITQNFSKKDKLILITDGVYEEFSEKGEELGKNKFFDFIKANAQLPPEELAKKTYACIENWVGEKGLHDDITIISIGHKK